ncbi:YhjD/YihY/BrkB family envelope integrity protein [Micropruina sp.]|uniref:YhjD/YihY/BrkB family envelope integrity protein n=1 Tax=Micropruina sp. TaxID=2737536 RepID=UPI0039E697F3
MPQWLEKLKAKPWIAHLLRMQERFTQRLGNQFAAAVTYFSVLSIVPVLLLAFSMLGMVLTVFRPDLLDWVSALIKHEFDNNPLGDQVIAVMERAFSSWATTTLVAVGIFAWSGASWMANLKSAIRAQMRTDFSEPEKKGNIVVETLANLGTLLVVLLTVLIMFTLAAAATTFSELILAWLDLDGRPFATFVVYAAPIPVSIAVGFALFALIYHVSYQQHIARRIWLGGALMGSIALTVLQYSATLIWGMFSGNAAASIFGPIIIMMLFFNIFATLILMIAAWMATAQTEPVVRSPLAQDVGDPPADFAEPPVPMVREAIAQRAVKVGMGTGYLVGAATGVGVGAIVAVVTGWLSRAVGKK